MSCCGSAAAEGSPRPGLRLSGYRGSWRHHRRDVEGNGTEVLRGKLQIRPGRQRRSVPQDVTDCLEGHCGAQQADRSCMSEGVWSLLARHHYIGGVQAASDHALQTGAILERSTRRVQTEKHLSQRRWRPRLFQVREERFSGFLQQGQAGERPCLRVPNMKDVLLPVDVIETERRNLASPQPVRREQLEDGVVAYPGCCHVLPSDRERLRDVLGAERRGYTFIRIHRWAGDRTAQ